MASVLRKLLSQSLDVPLLSALNRRVPARISREPDGHRRSPLRPPTGGHSPCSSAEGRRPRALRGPRTVAVLEEDGDGEGADFALRAGREHRVHRADGAQRLQHQAEDLGAELCRQVDEAIQDAGEEGLQDVGALRGFQLVTVAGETDKGQ